MKYAVFTTADQTIVYLSNGSQWTTKHEHALLLDSMDDVERAVDEVSRTEGKRLTIIPLGGEAADPPEGVSVHDCVLVEEVEDQAEFRSRPPTW